MVAAREVKDAVELWFESQREERDYLGLSEIGHPCPRYLWYAHHGYSRKALQGRILRIFDRGNAIEDNARIDIMSVGYVVHSRQKEVKIERGDTVLIGHIDGMIDDCLLEIKSSSLKEFKKLQKVGYETWKEMYKAQIHAYMTLMKATSAIAWVECKDNSEIYTEQIYPDMDYVLSLFERTFDTIEQPTPPKRKCPRNDWYEAKMCNFYEECF